MITLEQLFTFFEFIAEENTYIQHTPGAADSRNRFSRFATESISGQLSNLGFPRLEVVELPYGNLIDYHSSQHDTATVVLRVIYSLSDKGDMTEQTTKMDNAKKALMQMCAYILDNQNSATPNSLLCAFDLNSVKYRWLDKATFSGLGVGCELSISFKECIDWESVVYGDFPAYNGTIPLPQADGSYVLTLSNGTYTWTEAAEGGGGGGTWGSITGTLANQTDLQNALNAKANTVHTHVISDVTGLQTALNTKADVTYVDSEISAAVVGLLDDRGNYDASGNAFPSTGGSGTAGAILKGDLWTVSVAGTLGGTAVTAGDVVRALVDTPGQTSGNWAVSENNIGYVAENSANKATTMSGNTASNVVYLTAKAVYDYLVATYQAIITAASWGSFINGLTGKTPPVDADMMAIADSADSNTAKKLTFTNLKAYLKAYFDTLYAAAGGGVSSAYAVPGMLFGVVRNTGGTWALINDSDHEPSHAFTLAAGTPPANFRLTYPVTTYAEVGTGIFVLDETYAKYGLFVGASVGKTFSDVHIYSQGIAAYIAYNGSAWVVTHPTTSLLSGSDISVSFSAGTLTITHTPASMGDEYGITAEARESNYVCELGGAGATTCVVKFKDYTGALITTADTQMKFFFTRTGRWNVPNNKLGITNSNIWFQIIMKP